MSLRKAVNAQCKECIYDPYGGNGTWRQQVENCTAKNCPLYEYRPKTIQNPANKESLADGITIATPEEIKAVFSEKFEVLGGEA